KHCSAIATNRTLAAKQQGRDHARCRRRCASVGANGRRRTAARFPIAPRRARGAGPACARRSPDQQGHRVAPVGALAVPGRAGGGSAAAGFLCTNVTDSSGRRYDIPVAVGALAASPRIYAVGMGRAVAEIEAAWVRAIAHPIAPLLVPSPPCQAVVIKGEELRGAGKGLARLPVPISTPGFDAAPYLTATLCVTRDPDTG